VVVLNKIYTKTGDDGSTALGTGERRPKHDLRVAAYGTVDEANACIGMARIHTSGMDGPVDAMLARIQNDLFDLGADLATPETDEPPQYEPLRIIETQVKRIETDIDALNADLSPLRSFILPGGSPAAAALHLARTVSRRAERLMTELAQTPGETRQCAGAALYQPVSRTFLFVASRAVNENGARDVLWTPGENR
jgi:cob(I)alamin adenosyltransferase